MSLDQWTLYGVSYGTRLGLTLMRHDPNGVARAILDSVWPPALVENDGGAGGLDRALRRVFDSCREQFTCNADYPHLEASFSEIIERLRRHPLKYIAVDFDRMQALHVVIDAGVFIDITFGGLYWWEDIEWIPRMIHHFAGGDLTDFDDFAAG